MSFILKILIIMGIIFTVSSYIISRIYGNRRILNIAVFAIVFFPFLLRIIIRLTGKIKIVEIIDGNYLFFYNYFILGIIFISITHIILKIFKINFLEILSINQKKINVIFFLYLLMFGIMGRTNFNTVDIKIEKVTFNKKIEKEQLKIGFISDVHLSAIFSGEKFEKVLEIMEKHEVEAIFIGGDFLDNKHTAVKDDIKARLDRYNFKHGIFLILGNHEYYSGIKENMKYIESLGIKILRDEGISIDGIKIIGRDDGGVEKEGKKKLTMEELNIKEKILDTDPVIVIEHNPKNMWESIENGVDLYLAGHTHNGQFFPFNFIVERMYVHAKGRGKIKKTEIIVSSGLGTWLIPYRIGSQSEAHIIEISSMID